VNRIISTWRFVIALAVPILVLLMAAGEARADPLTCGPDNVGDEDVLSTQRDTAGNVFKIVCVNHDHIEGRVFIAKTGLTIDFGRCVFPAGANVINYEFHIDDKGVISFDQIDWINIKPPQLTKESRDEIIRIFSNDEDDPTDKWLMRVAKDLKELNLEGDENNRIYVFPFSPHDQQVDVFKNDSFMTEYVLTPDEANAAYLDDGLSPLPLLVIDPTMRLPDTVSQRTNTTIEPDTQVLLVLGLFGIVLIKTRGHEVAAGDRGDRFKHRGFRQPMMPGLRRAPA